MREMRRFKQILSQEDDLDILRRGTHSDNRRGLL